MQPPSPNFKQVLELVQAPLAELEHQLASEANNFYPEVRKYIHYACNSPGKRLRPVLAFLSGGSVGRICPQHVQLGVVLELVHLASLVHDDILDEAELRRGVPSTHAKWGRRTAVFTGDLILARSLSLATQLGKDLAKDIAQAVSDVCTGEVLQTQQRGNLDLDQAEYLKIIRLKTAALFAAASQLGGKVSQGSPPQLKVLHDFGLQLGTAYQIYDDCLDLVGTEASTGKTLGTDLEKGKLTLPIILLLESTHRQRGLELIQARDSATLVHLANKTGCVKQSSQTAINHIESGQKGLQELPANAYSHALQHVASYLHRQIKQLDKKHS